MKDFDLNKYQQLAARTLIDEPDFKISGKDEMIIWNAIGLAGEAGEVADLVKKGIYHQHGLDVDKIKKELGDVLWYVAAMCTKIDCSMSDIAEININKLIERYPDGYSSEDSINRAV